MFCDHIDSHYLDQCFEQYSHVILAQNLLEDEEGERDGDYDQESEDSSVNDDVIDSWMPDGDEM